MLYNDFVFTGQTIDALTSELIILVQIYKLESSPWLIGIAAAVQTIHQFQGWSASFVNV